MTTISTPKAPTPEKQKQFDDLMWLLAENAAATARGEKTAPLTTSQVATLDEMLALAAKGH